jgi:hypothetical protein
MIKKNYHNTSASSTIFHTLKGLNVFGRIIQNARGRTNGGLTFFKIFRGFVQQIDHVSVNGTDGAV